VDRTAIDTALFHGGDKSLDVVAHQIELVNVVLFRRVNGDLGRRQAKDKPALTGVDVGEPQNIAEKSTVRIRVLAVNDRMGANDHSDSSFMVVALQYPKGFYYGIEAARISTLAGLRLSARCLAAPPPAVAASFWYGERIRLGAFARLCRLPCGEPLVP
jgi:hypothetical protein